MTIEDVKQRVEHIRALQGDSEQAHAAEDKLWEDVLRFIAFGDAKDGSEIARIALKTLDIDFHRWTS